jgi:hypothetical protein
MTTAKCLLQDKYRTFKEVKRTATKVFVTMPDVEVHLVSDFWTLYSLCRLCAEENCKGQDKDCGK